MARQSNFRGISRRARALLSTGESKEVDYKEKVKGLHAEDLVAFANSEKGGAILIGVQEMSGKDGQQKGKPIGHSIDDDSRLQIMSKALSCSPPIQVDIIVENLADRPFYRVEIPSGTHKPYSTNSGTYKIREDARNSPLLPEQLLKVFLEREGEEFIERFSKATRQLESSMTETLYLVDSLENVISKKIEDIGNSVDWAESKASDAAETTRNVRDGVRTLKNEAKKLSQRIKAVIHKVKAEDPVKQRLEKEFLEAFIQELKEDPDLLAAAKRGKLHPVELSGDAAEELDEDDVNRLLARALEKIQADKSES